MSGESQPRKTNGAANIFGRCAAAILLGIAFGTIAFMIGISLFSLDLSPEQREPAIYAAVFSSGVAGIFGVGGFFIGPRAFDGLSGWTP